MTIEEITLSVPASLIEDSNTESTSNSNARGKQVTSATKVVKAYRTATRARDRFALTSTGRTRNREQFEQSLKAIVKNIATDAARTVSDKGTRMEVRTKIYAGVTQLAKVMSKDQLDVLKRSRTWLRWSLSVGAVGLLAIASTLVFNDLIKWPFY